MTVAICIFCCAEKFGAIVPCKKCGHAPRDDEQIRLSMLLSSHNIDRDRLLAAQPRLEARAEAQGQSFEITDADFYPERYPEAADQGDD